MYIMSSDPVSSIKFTTSAPGKVMLCGAYAVTVPPHPCWVLTTTACVHVHGEVISHQLDYVPAEEAQADVQCVLTSLQDTATQLFACFSKGDIRPRVYQMDKNTQCYSILSSADECANPFMLYALWCACLFICTQAHTWTANRTCRLKLVIDADKEFTCDGGKTGLGSSAAVTVSVVHAVLYGVACRHDDVICRQQESYLVYVLSYAAHSLASSKIGSGFDVAACTFGSLFYRRPVLSCVPRVLSFGDGDDTQELDTYLDTIRTHCNDNACVCPAAAASGVCVVLACFGKGSSTVKMVASLSAAVKNAPEGSDINRLWSELLECSMEVVDATDRFAVCRKYRVILCDLGRLCGVEIESSRTIQVFQNDSMSC